MVKVSKCTDPHVWPHVLPRMFGTCCTEHSDIRRRRYDGDGDDVLWMQLVMVRRRLCSITDVAPVAERVVQVGRRQGSTTDVAHLGWARLLIDLLSHGLPRVPLDCSGAV